VKRKLEAIGYGVLIPILVIVSGMQFHLTALTSRPVELLRVPLFLAVFLIIRAPRVSVVPPGSRQEGAGPPGAVFGHRTALDRGDHDHRRR
jgi:hypothetical protein